MVGLLDVVGERRGERAGLADGPARDQVRQLHHVGVLVHAVGDHQRRAGASGSRDHRLAIGDGVGHRLLQQHVDARFQGGFGEFTVAEHRRGHVDRVDVPAGQQVGEVVVAVHRDVVGHGAGLFLRTGHHCGDLGIGEAADRGNERLLGNLAEADDGETESTAVRRAGAGRVIEGC